MKKKVLIIENDWDDYMRIKSVFSKVDLYEIIEFSKRDFAAFQTNISRLYSPNRLDLFNKGKEYIDKLFSNDIDLIILDYELKKERIDGIDLLSKIPAKSIPILLITGVENREISNKIKKIIDVKRPYYDSINKPNVENWDSYDFVEQFLDACKNLIDNYEINIGIFSIIATEFSEMKKVFEINETNRFGCPYDSSQIIYRKSQVCNKTGKKINLFFSPIAKQGNVDSGIATIHFINNFKPKFMMLCGIAAGIKGKIRIGDIGYSRMIMDNTRKVASSGKSLNRGLTKEAPVPTQQMMTNHDFKKINLLNFFKETKLNEIPKYEDYKSSKFVAEILNPKIDDVGINSEDTLFKDADILQNRKDNNDYVNISEMEAAGFARACESIFNNHIPYLVIRSVSDFGDKFKKDYFHSLASFHAAAFTKYFIDEILDVDLLGNSIDFCKGFHYYAVI